MNRERASSGVDLHSLHNTSELSDVLHIRCVKMTAFVLLVLLVHLSFPCASLHCYIIDPNWSKMVQREV